MSDPYRLVHYGDLNGGVLLDADLDDDLGYFRSFDKPHLARVLWASPHGAGLGWAQYLGNTTGLQRWEIALAPDARLLTIGSLPELEALVAAFPHPDRAQLSYRSTGPDWRAVAIEYDAVHLTEAGMFATRWTTPDTTSWDCDSVAVFRAAQVCTVLTPAPTKERSRAR